VTREEQQAYVRDLVAAAPALSPADADTLRHLVPLQSRLTAGPAPVRPRPARPHAA